jgi:glycosyltransferase involved in cell wall biosynthesis
MLLHLKGDFRLITSDYPTKEKLDTSLNDIYATLFNKKIIVKENIHNQFRRLLFYFIPGVKIIPDDHVFWINEVCRIAKKLKKEIEPEVIVAFGRPHTDLIIGLKLKETFQIPLVIHFSDPWVDNPYSQLRGLVKRINVHLERKVMAAADLIFFTNEDQLQLVMQKYPVKIRQRARVLNHCFEAKLYNHNKGNPDKFIISHVGNLYGQRSPRPFLEAIALLLAENPELEKNIQVDFFGQISNGCEQIISEFDLEHTVKIHGSVSYLESLQVMYNSNLLLLIDAESEHNIFFPSKLADYIGSKRNILGITSKRGPSAKIINSYGGKVFVHHQVGAIKAWLREILEGQWAWKINKAEYEKYSAKNVAADFEEMVATVIS